MRRNWGHRCNREEMKAECKHTQCSYFTCKARVSRLGMSLTSALHIFTVLYCKPVCSTALRSGKMPVSPSHIKNVYRNQTCLWMSLCNVSSVKRMCFFSTFSPSTPYRLGSVPSCRRTSSVAVFVKAAFPMPGVASPSLPAHVGLPGPAQDDRLNLKFT